MKESTQQKIFISLVLVTLLGTWFGAKAWSRQNVSNALRLWQAETSYEEVADADALLTGRGGLSSVQVICDGTTNATLILYDALTVGAGAAGNKVFEMTVEAGETVLNHGKTWRAPLKLATGLSADIAGTNASYIVGWVGGP